MGAPLVYKENGNIIGSEDHNDIIEYIEVGSYRVNTNSLQIIGNEVISSGSNIDCGSSKADYIELDGQYWFPPSDGNANDVLMTNGAGQLSFGASVINLTSTNYSGSDCTGTTGSVTRQLVHTSTVLMVVLDTAFLHPTINYTTSGGSIISFNDAVWDEQNITIWS